MKRSICASCSALLLFAPSLSKATTLIVRIEKNRILIAADNRQGGSIFGRNVTTDDACKIRVLGNSTFAIGGDVGHEHRENGRRIVDWDSLADALAAFRSSGGNPGRFADEWGKLVASQVARYAQAHPNTIYSELHEMHGGIIAGGMFAYWTFGTPTVRFESIWLRQGEIVSGNAPLTRLDTDQSTNAVTEELIQRKSPRAKEAAREWNLLSRKYPADQASWRQIQFLIDKTSKFDKSVSQTSDVIEMRSNGKVLWLSRSACGR